MDAKDEPMDPAIILAEALDIQSLLGVALRDLQERGVDPWFVERALAAITDVASLMAAWTIWETTRVYDAPKGGKNAQ